MANIDTFDNALVHDGATERKASGQGFFARVLAAMITAREAKARTIVRAHLASLPDSQLSQLGYGEAKIKEIKAGPAYRTGYWY